MNLNVRSASRHYTKILTVITPVIQIIVAVGPNGGYVDSDEIYKGTVVWDRDCFLVKTDTDMFLLPYSEDCIEIIGNIHEYTEHKD